MIGHCPGAGQPGYASPRGVAMMEREGRDRLRTLSTVAVVLALGATACRGDERARVALTGPGQTGSAAWTTTDAAASTVWIDYDGAWTGHEDDPVLVYAVEVTDGAAVVQSLTCATSSCRTRVCGTTIQMGNRNDSDCECKTDCVVKVPRAGAYTVRATVTNPGGDFVGKNASLVLRE